LKKLNLQTLHIKHRHFDALFLKNVLCGTKYFPSLLETVGIRVPTRNINTCTTFTCSFSHCPSARCVSAANEQIFLGSHVSVQITLAVVMAVAVVVKLLSTSSTYHYLFRHDLNP
jgi:hypothetical protein